MHLTQKLVDDALRFLRLLLALTGGGSIGSGTVSVGDTPLSEADSVTDYVLGQSAGRRHRLRPPL